jgi:hypothetical protein
VRHIPEGVDQLSLGGDAHELLAFAVFMGGLLMTVGGIGGASSANTEVPGAIFSMDRAYREIRSL